MTTPRSDAAPDTVTVMAEAGFVMMADGWVKGGVGGSNYERLYVSRDRDGSWYCARTRGPLTTHGPTIAWRHTGFLSAVTAMVYAEVESWGR